jgi:outer membrane lipoprotein-sorting protein
MFLIVTGCAPSRPPAAPLPVYPAMDPAAALQILQARAEQIHTLSGTCSLVLTRANGESVQLDGAVVLAPPDRLRLRAWKAGQVVFDLTLRPDGLWIETPGDPQAKDRILPATNNAAQLGKELLEFTGGFFGDAVVDSATADSIVYRKGSVFCRVDRATLTPVKYWVVDSDGTVRFTLGLSDYRQWGGVLWAGHLLAVEAGGNTMDIEFDNVEINSTLAAGAFVPPRRAEKRP